MTKEFAVRTEISQSSLLSLILYLFYNADLLNICNWPRTNTSSLGFIDDVNILTYRKSIEKNCTMLEIIHKKCKKWADQHEAVFAPHKYELIHLSKSSQFNMSATVTINTQIIKLKSNIRVLGLQINIRLKWGAHIQKIQKKMINQSMALTKISTSTWGATFSKAKQICIAVVHPAMTYGLSVWHTPKDVKKSSSSNKLAILQNKYLWTIARAFKATLILVLKAETFIAPIDIHLDQLQAKARY